MMDDEYCCDKCAALGYGAPIDSELCGHCGRRLVPWLQELPAASQAGFRPCTCTNAPTDTDPVGRPGQQQDGQQWPERNV